ncbi:hypothetical protein FNV43_RR02475 [Rhamnella rubrinervis]|uniref:ZZ-type domain-containing protein n=1 Tax=Rhamnella rubrinervis TaxID=2594499 RepID=A0A8K0HTK5_9ROSA|nr:hypothetical protein FNV43_RR02475 [Rhamnella rubrinervis]
MACYRNPPDEFWKRVREEYDSRSEEQFKAYHLIAATKDRFPGMANQQLFNKVKKKGRDGWDTKDVITLLYIIWSGRPVCDGCGDLVTGVYFTCRTCFNCPGETFNVCPHCRQSGKFDHHHNDFVDNFNLLHVKREQLKQLQNVASGLRPLLKD